MDDNIILFPKNRIANNESVGYQPKIAIPQTVDEVKSNIKLLHHAYINEIVETILPMISAQLTTIGCTITTEQDLKDGALFIESFRSLLCKRFEISHPFQTLANNLFNEEEGGELRLNNDLNMKFAK